ncbi:hypothetical protein UP09_07065 [Bradyrhizobium sp. LTSP885]|uniref:hypothetical protein n=1 Tax=Bradyrhizobium sp. LTSP885 TaxID=1619232 RepID=UPI0005CAC944|nr:hypothetical protein [Bradyrhizobium sp. LTSP885]KJC49458.1 hypothetical protein UP09_07065 [Bradyrhizobium sp. LTSP885]
MRGLVAALTVSAFLAQPAFAQGIKDPPNYPLTASQSAKKSQTSTADPSRPTTVQNVATGKLPPGVAAQAVWKDGKLTTIQRR